MNATTGRFISSHRVLMHSLTIYLGILWFYTTALRMQMATYIWVRCRLSQLILGHALNKILKDIILRYHILQRRKVSYVPGWDCHGLPIELKAVKSKSDKELSAPIIRSIARRFAEKTVLKQMDEFKGWAVTGDWENRWCTMGLTLDVKVNTRSEI